MIFSEETDYMSEPRNCTGENSKKRKNVQTTEKKTRKYEARTRFNIIFAVFACAYYVMLNAEQHKALFYFFR